MVQTDSERIFQGGPIVLIGLLFFLLNLMFECRVKTSLEPATFIS
jgi:hypothetical protein